MPNYTTEQLTNCLRLRLEQYETAIKMADGEVPYDQHFNWPGPRNRYPESPLNVAYWRGAAAELRNTLDMMNSKPVNVSTAENTVPPLKWYERTDMHIVEYIWRTQRVGKNGDAYEIRQNPGTDRFRLYRNDELLDIYLSLTKAQQAATADRGSRKE